MSITINGSTGVSGVDGSSTTPAFQGTDTNTGLFYGTDIVGISTGGSERVRVDSSGNVGIGTTSPTYRLQASNTNGDTQFGVYDLASSGSSAARLDIRTSGTGASQWLIQTGNTASGLNGALRFYDQTVTTERMRIDSSGNVGIGTTNPSYKLQVYGASNPEMRLGDATVTYQLYTEGATAAVMGTVGSHALVFRTNATERMRLDNSGNLLVGTTDSSPAGNNGTGISLETFGSIQCSRSGGTTIQVNRKTNDGDLMSFRQDGTQEGTISVSGTTVSYNGGHLSRWSQWQNETGQPNVYRGTILESTNDMCEWEKDGEPLPNEQATKTIVSTTVASKAVAGVFDRYDEDDENNPYDFYVAQSGDFVIRIAQGVIVQNGDLLESAGDGTAKPQADDICRSSTIAKVTSNYVSATYEDGSYCVPCILMIG